jgi:hypothetical protein
MILSIMLLLGVECFADYGPAADVKNARQAQVLNWLEHWPNYRAHRSNFQIYDAVVVNRYGLVSWQAGKAAGQSIFLYTGRHWRLIDHWGGASGVRDLERFGVPRDVAMSLLRHQRP